MAAPVTVDVQQSGEIVQRVEFGGQVACSEAAHQLERGFGAGSLGPADSDVRLVSAAQLEPGRRYVYTVFPCAGAGGNITARQLLSSALPVAGIHSDASASSSSVNARYLKPTEVECWEHEDAPATNSMMLFQAIIRHQDSADNITHALPPPRPSLPEQSPLRSEAEYVCALNAHVLDPLMRLQSQADWSLQGRTRIIQDGVVAHAGAADHPAQAGTAAVPHQAPGTVAPSFSQHGRLQQVQRRFVFESGSGYGAKRPSSHWSDVVLKRARMADMAANAGPAVHNRGSSLGAGGADAGAAAAAAACTAGPVAAVDDQPYICVGGVRVAGKLLLDGSMKPIGLQQAWRHNQDPNHANAQAVVSQLYTYMRVARVCHGFISCYFATWLAYCPADNPGRLYLSEPLLAASKHSPTSPAATTLGALSWLQEQALNSTVRLPALVLDDWEYDGAGGTTVDSGDSGPGLDNSQVDPSCPSSPKKTASSPTGKGDGSGGDSGGNSSAGQLEQSGQCASMASPGLRLQRQLCRGSSGLVMVGEWSGEAAVVKLLGPDSEGLSALDQECSMYAELQAVQGKLIPCFLAAGHLAAGVHFLATGLIDGLPLSSLAVIPPAVAEAAVNALESLAATFPGFLHGDLRLANVLVLSSGSNTAPRCMWLDLARSRLDGTVRQQKAEQRHLKRLLGMVP